MPQVGKVNNGKTGLPDEGLALAVNLYDLDRHDPVLKRALLGGNLHAEAIWMDRSDVEETGVAFACDLVVAAVICDRLRDADRKAQDPPCRVYLRRSRAWERLAGGTVLTTVRNGKKILNPAVFPLPKKIVTIGPPARKRTI